MKILSALLAVFFLVTAPCAHVIAGPDDEKKVEFFVIHKDGGPGRIPIKVESLAIDAHCGTEPDMVVKGLREVEVVAAEAADGVPSLLIRLNEKDAKRFAEMSGDSIGKRILILVCDEPITAPTVMDRIAGGRVMISAGDADKIRELERTLRGMVKD